jgi:uncharacterized membrane protein YgcG
MYYKLYDTKTIINVWAVGHRLVQFVRIGRIIKVGRVTHTHKIIHTHTHTNTKTPCKRERALPHCGGKEVRRSGGGRGSGGGGGEGGGEERKRWYEKPSNILKTDTCV